MPTFQFFKDGQKVEEVVGANPRALLTLLQQLNPGEAEAAKTEEPATEEGAEKKE